MEAILRLMILKAVKPSDIVAGSLSLVAFLIGSSVCASTISGTLSVDLENTLSGIVEESIVISNTPNQGIRIIPTPLLSSTPSPNPTKMPRPKIIKKTSSKLSGQINNFYVENIEKPRQDILPVPTITPKKVQYSILTTPIPQPVISVGMINNSEDQANILFAMGDRIIRYFGVIRDLLIRALLAIVSFMNITELPSK